MAREIMILRPDPRTDKNACVFAIFNRKIGWFQHDYAKGFVDDLTNVTVSVLSQDGTQEFGAEIYGPTDDGPFHVRVFGYPEPKE